MFLLVDIDFILNQDQLSYEPSLQRLQLGLQDQTLSREKILWTVKHRKVKVWRIKINSPNSPMFSTANVLLYTVAI